MRKTQEAMEDHYGVVDYEKKVKKGEMTIKEVFAEGFLYGASHQINVLNEQHKNWEDGISPENFGDSRR